MSLSHLFDWCLPLTLIPISVAKSNCLCGSRGLVAMGGDWCPKGCGFKSQHHVLDVHIFFLKIVMFFVNKKEAGVAHYQKYVFVNSCIILERLKTSITFPNSVNSYPPMELFISYEIKACIGPTVVFMTKSSRLLEHFTHVWLFGLNAP